MINWNTYKTMSKTQKEEYNFKFVENNPTFNLTGILAWASIFIFSIIYMLFAAYVLYNEHGLAEYKEQIDRVIASALDTAGLLSWTIILLMVINVVKVGLHIFRERRWLNKNKVKTVWGWPFKWKK